MPIFDVNSLVSGTFPELTAITTLIGSATAESLILGNKGASGLPWATMSMFGIMSVIRACIAASTPNWMKDALGVRNAVVEKAVGLSLIVRGPSAGMDRARNSFGEPIGITCQQRKEDIGDSNPNADDSEAIILQDVYVFDQFTARALDSLPPSQSTGAPRVHVFLQDRDEGAPVTKLDWLLLFLSVIKLIELYTLWALQAPILSLVSAMPWFYFFFAATFINHHQILRGAQQEFGRKRVDIAAGQLPTSIKAGGNRQILLGVPQVFRHDWRWNVTWAIGSVICIATLMSSYLMLRRSQSVAPLWFAFQAIWLLLRTAYFYFAKDSDRQFQVINISEAWENLTYRLKKRVRLLAVGLSLSLVQRHPRGHYAYKGDLVSLSEIQSVLTFRPDLHHHFPLDATFSTDATLELSILGVIGDTTLTAVTWFSGSPLGGMDLYDCCLLFFAWQDGQILRIPAMRVLASVTPFTDPQSDEEKRMELLAIPKGTSNRGMQEVKWIYWVPCVDGRWLQLESFDSIVKGKQRWKVMTSDQIGAILSQKSLAISFTKMEVIEQTVHVSRAASKFLTEFMST